MSHEPFQQNSVYFDACRYCEEKLGDNAVQFFPRLHELSRHNSLDELRSITDGWELSSKPKAIPPDRWVAGSRWGDCIRVEHDKGIMWKLRCSCGIEFWRSTNDTVLEHHRKCDSCILADSLSAKTQEHAAKLESISAQVVEWHRVHSKLIFQRVHRALRKRATPYDDTLVQELSALCWVKIASVAGKYQDNGFKVSAWLGRVADNCLRDYFKINDNRQQLAPMSELTAKMENFIADPNGPSKPAKPTRPAGASPTDDATNTEQREWDRKQGWNG